MINHSPAKFNAAAYITGLGAALILSTAAHAQEQGPPAGESVFDGDYVTIGGGVGVGPSYDGSDDYVISPLPVIIGSFAGLDFQPRGPGVAVDVIPDTDGAKIDFVLGPVVRARFDRNNSIEDDVVRSLGKLDVAVELGGVAGIQVNRVLHPFDSLTAQVDLRWDVAGAHSGMVVFPSLTYFTPLSRGVAVSFALNAEYVDDDYADYYFSIDQAGSTASGLPTFGAEGGWKNVGATIFTGIDLDGDVTNGGFGLFVLGGYSRLLEDAKRSPVTSIRGDADQFFGAVGVGYTF
ncbi:MipA/OmpV family protein [Parasphingorhabdus cellanae]|uniref:MipA/OmpV family protein n=1 Tax=Parasphingorhabdus cellanae TaxID=2806553 RepID=A0ABX7T581_9SPHN|nr:MipA/OmpV family protein [Parasphingorhabdus cellanae]QTD56749.1 MipA/OmpV family protein [Parasphingorhabdus cellanae]